jgi:5-methylcytosine-specific restriction endonuclease McrA
MFAYCVQQLHFSEEVAYKRIRAARTARRFPAILPAVAEGRLHLTAVVLLAPCLSSENADELLAAATHRSKSEIEALLARRFPRPDLPTRVQAMAPTLTAVPAAPELVGARGSELDLDPVQNRRSELDPDPVAPPEPRPRVAPLSPERYGLQLTMGKSLHDKLRYAQALLSHRVAPGEVAEVLELALDALIAQLEKQKFAATSRPRAPHGPPRGRHIPAEVKRQVWKRDQGRCTFVSASGRRCDARRFLEYDHIEPVARGGKSTFENLRLRCRAHNQYEAECEFGAGFMHEIRERARGAHGATSPP